MTRKLRLLVSVALLSWLGWQTDWQQVGTAFTHLRIELWLAAVGVLVLTQFVSSVRWQMLARPLGLERPLSQLVGFYFIGMYFNLLLPTSVGGDVVRAWYLDGQSGNRLNAFISVFLDRLCGLWILLLLACLGVLMSPLELPTWIPLFVWGCAGCAAAGLTAMPILTQHSDKAPWKFRQLLEAFKALPSWRAWVGPVLLSVFVQVANVVIVWLVGQALGAPVPFAYYWLLVPMVSLLTMLPISVNGMGVREGAMALLLAPLGVSGGIALTLAFLWFAVSATVSLLGGLVYLFGRFPRPAVGPATSGEGQTNHEFVNCDTDQGREGQFKAAA